MVLYFIPCIIAFLSSIQYDVGRRENSRKYIIWWGLYIYLLLLIGLRYMVGGDSYFYMLYFNEADPSSLFDLSWDSEYQPLFTFLVSLSKIVYPDFVSFQLLHAFIINTSLFYFISKNTPYRFAALSLCFLCFYINFSVEILRESLAIIIFIFNYKNLEEKKWLKYYVGVGFAFMFHLSAIFLIVLPFFVNLKLNRKYIILLVLSCLILYYLEFVFSFFGNIEKIGKKINDYSEAAYGWKSTFLFLMTRTLIPVGLGFWAKKKLHMPIKYESMLCVFGLLGVGSVFNAIIFTRFSNYLMPLYVITLAGILCPCFKKAVSSLQKQVAFLLCIIIFVTYSIGSFYWPDRYYQKWIPYYSIFSWEYQIGFPIDRDY